MLRPSREAVVAFRAAALHLDYRLPAAALVDAVRPCGFQDTPPGNAAVAAAARVEGFGLDLWNRELTETRTLVALWAMRGSPFVVATDDFGVFSAGLLPDGEEATLRRITSDFAPTVVAAGVSAGAVVDRLTARAHEVLDGCVLTKRELGEALGPAVPEPLRRACESDDRPAWGSYDALSALALTVARLVSHHGAFVIAPRTGNELVFARTDQWLGAAPALEPEAARAELARRFLRAFAPATAADYAWWATEQTSDRRTRVTAERWAEGVWELLANELEEVAHPDGRRAFALAVDADRLRAPPVPAAVRLIPPHDPLLMLRDRETLVPDRALHKRLWRSQHNPGAVLAGAEVVATWKARKDGGRLTIEVEPLRAALDRRIRDAVDAEAALVAAPRGAQDASVTFADA